MNFKHLAAIVLTALTLGTQVNATDLLLYGGQEHDEFLGCLVCDEYSGESVCNAYGQYGNAYGSNMWNEYSQPYGSEYNAASPWNEFSNSDGVPILMDRSGKFYGYFTINEYRNNAVDFAPALNSIYTRHKGDVEKVRETLCEWLN